MTMTFPLLSGVSTCFVQLHLESVTGKKEKLYLWVPCVRSNLPGMTRIPPVHLPPKVKWVDEGDKYLGGFLGSPQYGQKNCDGVAERVQKD